MATEFLDLTRLPILSADALLTRQGIDLKLKDWRTLIGLNDDFFNQMVRDPFYRYAEAIQLAPASEADHHANPGGLLSHSYDVITLGLKRRRGLQLPHGGSIDQINEQRHLWTYAIFAGGLLHDIGKLMASIRLRLQLKKGTFYHWTPQDKPLRQFPDVVSYSVEFVKTPYSYHSQIALTLFDFLPTSGRAWLAREPAIMMQLCAFLRGDRFESGVIGEILERADMTSTAMSQKLPTQQRFSTKPSTIERLVHWVRNWIIEGDIKINRNGGMGWIDVDGHLYMVCRSLADKIIRHCDDSGITDIPLDPIRLYDIFQDYGFALPTPEGKAIWNMLIECEDYQHSFTCLKFEMRRFTIPTRPMAPFEGTVTVYRKPQVPAIISAAAPQNQLPEPVHSASQFTERKQEPDIANQADASAPSSKAAAKTRKNQHHPDHVAQNGGGVSSPPDSAFAQDQDVVPIINDEIPWGDSDVVDHPTTHHKTRPLQNAVSRQNSGQHQETQRNHETAPDQEAATSQEAAQSQATGQNHEAALSHETEQDQEAAASFFDEEDPVFLDFIASDAIHHTEPVAAPGPLAQETLRARNQTPASHTGASTEVSSETVATKENVKKFSRYTISGVPSFEPGMVTIDTPDIARMFVSWLRINMNQKTIQMNCPDALVHIMPDCVLLLAPGIFKNFLQLHGVGTTEMLEKYHKKLSEKFQRLRINIKTSTVPSINIHKVYAVGKTRASKLSGWKIPLSVIYSDASMIPAPNRFIKDTPDI